MDMGEWRMGLLDYGVAVTGAVTGAIAEVVTAAVTAYGIATRTQTQMRIGWGKDCKELEREGGEEGVGGGARPCAIYASGDRCECG